MQYGNRREMLTHFGIQGLAATALVDLWKRDGLAAEELKLKSATDASHASSTSARGNDYRLPAKAKRVIHIALVGGMSHLDSFDFKPELLKMHGKPLVTKEKPDIFFGQMGLLRGPDWKFEKRGQSGLPVSELFPHIARQADLMTVVNSMVTESANHTPALFFENSGFQFNGFPSLGSWLAFGLGSESENLPAFVVLPDQRGGPNGGPSNWSAGFLPAQFQGVAFGTGAEPVRDLNPRDSSGKSAESDIRRFIETNNAHHAAAHGEEPLLQARMRSYALAARMQLSVPEVADISGENAETQELYGLNDPKCAEFARRALLARRMVERGVRYVQLYSGGPIAGAPRASWDAHESVLENHGTEAAKIDKPVAALLHDCQRRGLLDDTLILFTTEFGRTPFTQTEASKVGTGRDHNRYAFSVWMAGAGLKPGTSYGATDEIGWKAVEKPATWHDFHATVLHLLGVDHEKLTYYHNGIRRRLTNVHGAVMKEVLA